MRRRDAPAALALAALLCVPARALKTEVFSTTGTTPASGTPQGALVTAGQAIVRLSSSSAAASLDAALAARGFSRGPSLGGGWTLITWTSARSVSQALGQLQGLAGVAQVQPSNVYKIRSVPSDPLLGSQYALTAVHALNAWDLETGYSSRVTIAVVDSGIDGTQPDLSAKLGNAQGIAFDPNTGAVAAVNDPLVPACEHATHVAGVAAASANNHFEVAGMSWGAQLASLKVFADADCNTDCSASGCLTNDPAIIAAINYATGVVNTAAWGKIVVNMSLGGGTSCSGSLQTAVSGAVSAGVVLVAAAGNSGAAVESPGVCTGVIPVGATDSADHVASFSDFGTALANNGLVAPGVSVLTTDLNSKTVTASGTSFSSPMVAGAAALMIAAKPGLTPAQVQSDLRSAADDIGYASTYQGAGRLNAYKAVYLALNGSLPPSTPASPALPGLPPAYAFPNPLRLSQQSHALFFLPPPYTTSGATINIYTLDGRIVATIGTPVWDGRNADGNLVASGTYVFVVTDGSQSTRGRLTVIR